MRFKQIIENSTTAGSVATVAQPMMTQARESVNVPGLKPVQAMKDKSKKKGPYANSIVESKVNEDDLAEQDLIVIPGQGRLKRTGFVKHDLDQGEHEGHTLKNSLHTIARAASDLDKRLSVQSEFPEWVSEKIGAAKGMMVTVMDYLISSQEMQHDRDAMAESHEDDEECSSCDGTGEGRHEGQSCGACGGSGVARGHYDDDDFDIPDDDDMYEGVAEGLDDTASATPAKNERGRFTAWDDDEPMRLKCEDGEFRTIQEINMLRQKIGMKPFSIKSQQGVAEGFNDTDTVFLTPDTGSLAGLRYNTFKDASPEEHKKAIQHHLKHADRRTPLKAAFHDMRAKMHHDWLSGKQGVAEDAHGSEAFQDIVQRANGDVRGIYKELQERGLHSEIKEFCLWARHQGIADINDAMKLAYKVDLAADEENEIAGEGYFQVKELLGLGRKGVAEAAPVNTTPEFTQYVYSKLRNHFTDLAQVEDLFDYAYLSDVTLGAISDAMEENGTSAKQELKERLTWLLKNMNDRKYKAVIKPIAVEWMKLVAPTLGQQGVAEANDYFRRREREEGRIAGTIPAKKAVVKTNKPIGFRISDIGPGGKEYNVKTDAAWDAAKKKVSEGSMK